MGEVGIKHDTGKRPWNLAPWREIGQVMDVIGYGAKRYGEYNWQHVEPKSRYVAAMFRHLTAWTQGEKNDIETGFPHLAHAACNVLFLLWTDNEKASGDHRDVPEKGVESSVPVPDVL